VFYGWWDYKFLTLIFLSSITDFVTGLGIGSAKKRHVKIFYLILSITVNLGALIVFKYYNFFIDSFSSIVTILGFQANVKVLSLILPVGISFYTFQTMSYTIDIYNGSLKPTKNIVAFFAFVSFFPQLVAGPIERARHLLPQFKVKHAITIKSFEEGLFQIMWGLFKKVVIADNCGVFVDRIFADYGSLGSINLALGVVLFAFQIYGDFSGYSDMAIGIARLFGFDLSQNFNYPYFSKNITEFWRRWHISLSTWFRDYLYIPLGGNQASNARFGINIFVVFLLSGLWHGANFTFLIWGGLHAIYYLIQRFYKEKLGAKFNIHQFAYILLTFISVSFAWVFFRANTVQDAWRYIGNMLQFDISQPIVVSKRLIAILFVFVTYEWLSRHKSFPLEGLYFNKPRAWFYFYILTFFIYSYGIFNRSEFIYFQF
jgi:alginate O-acetyltransferase complex protein AlgI